MLSGYLVESGFGIDADLDIPNACSDTESEHRSTALEYILVRIARGRFRQHLFLIGYR